MATVLVKNETRLKSPRFPFGKIVEEVLPGWEVSLVFTTPKKAQVLNERLRNKTYVPNVLSYTLGTKSGEIIICTTEAARQAPEYEMSARVFILYLFIHALLHLKGWGHGVTMERCEKKLVEKFAAREKRAPAHGTPNSDWNRHRNLSGKGRRR